MQSRRGRTLVCLTAAFAVLGAAFDFLLLFAWGSRAPAWSHWLCSPPVHAAAQHRGQPADSATATLLGSLEALVPHWPHILPILIAVATVAYLRRASARYHAQGALPRAGA